MRSLFMVFPILWFIVVAGIIFKIISGAARPKHPGKNVPPPNYQGRGSSTQNRSILDYIKDAEIIKDAEKDSAEHPAKASSHPVLRPKKNFYDKLNGEDQPKRGKLSRESRDDEKNWF